MSRWSLPRIALFLVGCIFLVALGQVAVHDVMELV